MSDVNLDKNYYFNNMTGKYQLGVRDPEDHTIKFEEDEKDQPKSQDEE